MELLHNYRLVTVTGPGGVGKTRLVAEVARHLRDQFPDGVWPVELAAVADPAHVSAEVTSALGVQQARDRSQLEVLAQALASRRLLLVLDNCEHVLPAVVDLCEVLLTGTDEVRILATSREQLGVGAEARYRLSPLELPDPGDPSAVGKSEAVALFTERARQADPHFALTSDNSPLVARVVARLDGIPLAIELAAARVEALGMAGLADRIDDAFRLLAPRDPWAAARHSSLAAVADWSYRLLTEQERRVFRRLAVFPGPFTLASAEAVAGPEAGPVTARLVDCSLLVPPRPAGDQRTRYTMLETLREYGLARLEEAGEEPEATMALAGIARSVARQATAGLQTSDQELDAARWLDAEDATLGKALSWTLEHEPDAALPLATALAPWLRLRGRLAEAHERLSSATAGCSPADGAWASAQLWLGHLAVYSGDPAGGADRYTAVDDAHQGQQPSRVLVEALAVRAVVRVNLGDISGGADDACRALALARDLGDAAAELLGMTARGVGAYGTGDVAGALDWARQAQELLPLDVPGYVARWCRYVLASVLTRIGELDSARRVCAAGLPLSRQVGDRAELVPLLGVMANIERLAGNLADAKAHLREAVVLASRIGTHLSLANLIAQGGHLCAASGQWADAVTLWAAYSADREHLGRPPGPASDGRRAEYRRRAEQVLDPSQVRAAEERGARMRVSAAAELVLMLTEPSGPEPGQPSPAAQLSPRERELVVLVAEGRTNAEIAARLYISVRTVASHLDRIRDKTGCRRRADLTRLALKEGLV
jgi:non-specific serine/threonine protein kinase